MIWTKWFQGISEDSIFLDIRRKVLNEIGDSGELTDIYDQFAFNLVAYNDDAPAGIGRLLFKEGRYFIDNIYVFESQRDKNIADLIIRMLVRKSVDLGSDKVYTYANDTYEQLLKKIGFEKSGNENGEILMVKVGDVGGCC